MDNDPKAASVEQERRRWMLSRVGVMVMLFIVLGPFGLGFLYKSNRFSRNAKILLTIGVMVYTGIIMVIIVGLIMYIYRQIGLLLHIS